MTVLSKESGSGGGNDGVDVSGSGEPLELAVLGEEGSAFIRVERGIANRDFHKSKHNTRQDVKIQI